MAQPDTESLRSDEQQTVMRETSEGKKEFGGFAATDAMTSDTLLDDFRRVRNITLYK